MLNQSNPTPNANETTFGVDADGTPHAYRRAVTDFASSLGLDAQTLIDGGRLDSGGLGFWLQHHGSRDPRAMTVFVDIGQLPEEPAQQLAVLRELLEKNVTTPGAIAGYYGVIPETSQCVMCTRLALDNVDSEGDALGMLIASLIGAVDKTREVLQLVMDEMIKRTADAPLERV